MKNASKKFSPYCPKFYLRRADGKETFVSSHQPDARKGGKRDSAAQLMATSKSILAMNHWQQWLNGQSATLIVVNAFNDAERVEVQIS